MKIICFDIGGTKILKAVVKIRGRSYKFLETEEEKNPRKEKKIKNILLDYCQKARKKYWAKKVAFSAAYIIDTRKKTVTGGKTCYGTKNFDFKFIEKKGFSVRAENDGRCFALGEYYFGKGKNTESLFSMTLGTNIGGGYVIQGKNFRGAHQSAMEISYLNFFYDNKWQDWGDFCAGEGIEKIYKNALGKTLSAKDIFGLVAGGNQEAKKIIAKAAGILGMGIANILNTLDPEVVVFGGSISKQKKYINNAISIAKKNAMNKKANYKFAISVLGNRANLLGAASLYK